MPGAELRTADLVDWCYPRADGKPNRNQWRAIGRAAEKVAVRVSRTHTRPGGVVFMAEVGD